jgi:dTDP-4-amino-4,6-dideoxygalactose transaminase
MEGGFGIATNNPQMADDFKSMRSHGWSRDRSDNSIITRDLSLPNSKFTFLTAGLQRPSN